MTEEQFAALLFFIQEILELSQCRHAIGSTVSARYYYDEVEKLKEHAMFSAGFVADEEEE